MPRTSRPHRSRAVSSAISSSELPPGAAFKSGNPTGCHSDQELDGASALAPTRLSTICGDNFSENEAPAQGNGPIMAWALSAGAMPRSRHVHVDVARHGIRVDWSLRHCSAGENGLEAEHATALQTMNLVVVVGLMSGLRFLHLDTAGEEQVTRFGFLTARSRALSQTVATPPKAINPIPTAAQGSGAFLNTIQLISAAKAICA